MYRQGAVGALLDVYEQATSEIKKVIEDIPDAVLASTVDPQTTDENCKSIQTVLSHIISSGYSYVIYIHNLKGAKTERPAKVYHSTIKEYLEDFHKMMVYTENVLRNLKDDELEQTDDTKKISTSWQQRYDIEQLMEHAIVHLLRHKMQIEKFKITVTAPHNSENSKIQ